MKNVSKLCFAIVLILLAVPIGHAQENETIKVAKEQQELKVLNMKTYLIERELPGAGELSNEQLKGISQKSCTVISEMGTGIQWLHSYVTDDKVYCIYRADDVEKLRIHAEKGGFPITEIRALGTTISPETAKK